MVRYHNTTIVMAEKFESFYIDHISRQQNAHADALASLATSLALSVGATERILVYSCDLYCYKFGLEDSKTPRRDLQVKEILDFDKSRTYGLVIPLHDFVLYGILPDDPKEAAAIKRKAPRLYYNEIMQTCIIDRMTKSYSKAFHIKRHRGHSKKLMMVCAELINLDPSLETGLKDLAITSRR